MGYLRGFSGLSRCSAREHGAEGRPSEFHVRAHLPTEGTMKRSIAAFSAFLALALGAVGMACGTSTSSTGDGGTSKDSGSDRAALDAASSDAASDAPALDGSLSSDAGEPDTAIEGPDAPIADGGSYPAPCQAAPTPLPTGKGYYAMASSPDPTDLNAALQWADTRRVADGLAQGTLTIAPGTYMIGGFVNAVDPYGTPTAAVVAPTNISIQGSGVTCTVFKLDPSAKWTTTVTDAGATPNYTTNQYDVIRIDDNGKNNQYNDFTLDCSRASGSWPHEFNGIEVRSATSSQINRAKVIGVPGSENTPPHETFYINYYRSTGVVTSNVELDGDHVGASGFAPNDSTGLVFNNVWSHDMAASHGIADYNSKDTTINGGLFENNGVGTGRQGGIGINNEGSLGTFTFNNCTSRGNSLSATRIYADTNSFSQGGQTTAYIYKDGVLTAGASGVAIRYDGLQADAGERAQLPGTTVTGKTTYNP